MVEAALDTRQLDGRRPGLARRACDALRADQRSIIITGASGWIGRATLDLLVQCLGSGQAQDRISCFGSRARAIELADGTRFEQQAMEAMGRMARRPALLLHLAFLTKDKVALMAEEDYRRSSRSLSRQLFDAIAAIGADRLFLASSGAAAFADQPGAAADLRLYGAMKREDERLFSAWAEAAPGRRAVIARIFSLSGPYINKYQTYALASFILDALDGRPIAIHAPMPVVRSYVAIRELMSVIFCALLEESGDPVVRFDSGGEQLELGQLADLVGQALGSTGIRRPPITSPGANHFAGDDRRYRELLARHGLEPVDMLTQVRETAAFLAAERGAGR